MKILLTTLNAKYIHSNLALKYLYTAASEVKDCLRIQEFSINQDDDLIYTELLRWESDVLCFSCYIWNIERILYLAETIKKARPKTLILLGGPEVSFRGEEILAQNPSIDLVLCGEAEETFPKLLRVIFAEAGEEHLFTETFSSNTITDFEKALGYYGVDGLVFRNEGSIVKNTAAEQPDFCKIPFPYQQLPCETDKIVYYESSRGCPYGCTYCLSSLDRGVRALPVERVKQDVRYFLYKGIRQVKFLDRTFNYDAERAYEIFRYLMEIDNKTVNFHFEICGELMDERSLELLEKARPGLFQFEIGVQSTNPETLEAIKRKGNFDKLSSVVRRIREKRNIHLHLDLIAGLPFEDVEVFHRSFNQVYSLRPDALQLGFLKLLPGTPIAQNAGEHGYVCRSRAPYELISNRYLQAKDLLRLKMIEKVFDLYYNRGGFEKTLEAFTEEIFGDAFSFYEEFADFYYKNGFQDRSQSKENQYRILRQYSSSFEKENPEAAETLYAFLEQDLKETMNPDAVKKFVKQGWALA